MTIESELQPESAGVDKENDNDAYAFLGAPVSRVSVWINRPRNRRLQSRWVPCFHRARVHRGDRRKLDRRRASFAAPLHDDLRRRTLSDHLVDHRIGLICGGDQFLN